MIITFLIFFFNFHFWAQNGNINQEKSGKSGKIRKNQEKSGKSKKSGKIRKNKKMSEKLTKIRKKTRKIRKNR